MLHLGVPVHLLNIAKPELGGYQSLLSTIQGTQVFIHYIEGSTAQLVKHKALNLVDVGSNPTMEVTLYNVIFNDYIYKVPAHYYIMTRHFGATSSYSSLHDHIFKVPAHYCIMTRHLGAIGNMDIKEEHFQIFSSGKSD